MLFKSKIRKIYDGIQRYSDIATGGNCVFLLYHRITDLNSDPQLLAVSPQNFNAQLNYLKHNCKVLSIEEVIYHIEKKIKFPKNSVALSFDDGYADNYSVALPLLESNGCQAIFYISTSTISTAKEFWWDEVERLILMSTKKEVNFNINLNDLPLAIRYENVHERKKTYEFLLPILRVAKPVERKRFISELSEHVIDAGSRLTHRAMTFDELIKLADSSSAVIGAHTHNHASLAALNYEEQYDEIKLSKEILEKHIGKQVINFSYPFGTRKDYNQNSIQICIKLGIKMAAANYPYPLHARSPRYELPRYLVRNWSIEQFAAELKHFHQYI